MDKNNFNHRDFSDLNLPLGGKIKKYAKIKMYKAKSNCIKDSVYIDDGLTGTDYDRPDFQRMIHDMEVGKVNCIICKNLSELLRSGIFFGKDFSHE